MADLWTRVVVTGGAGFIGSNLTLAIQERHPDAEITVFDDFRSGDFANLRDFRGDVRAFDLSRGATHDALVEIAPTLVFHLASITDTTEHDNRLMVHDNVEGFRPVLTFCRAHRAPLVYASSAATYGQTDGRMSETTPAAPANVYAFSKVMLDNLTRRALADDPDRHIVGLRYFNVYGPREAHKGRPASMAYHLAEQMRAGKRPRVFKHGEQRRDFVYVKDVVEATLLAAECDECGIFNVGSGEARSFNEMIAALNDVLGTDYAPEYFDCPYPFYQPFTEADLTASRRVLGYEPRYRLEDGVADYMAWLYGVSGAPKHTRHVTPPSSGNRSSP